MSLHIFLLECSDCGRTWEDDGDDIDLCFHGFECPYCHSRNYKKVSER